MCRNYQTKFADNTDHKFVIISITHILSDLAVNLIRTVNLTQQTALKVNSFCHCCFLFPLPLAYFHTKTSYSIFRMPTLHRRGFAPLSSKKRKRDSNSQENLTQLARENNLYKRLEGNFIFIFIIIV